MDIGVFIPIGNNGWLISETAPQYMPSFELNKEVVQKAEKYGFGVLPGRQAGAVLHRLRPGQTRIPGGDRHHRPHRKTLGPQRRRLRVAVFAQQDGEGLAKRRANDPEHLPVRRGGPAHGLQRITAGPDDARSRVDEGPVEVDQQEGHGRSVERCDRRCNGGRRFCGWPPGAPALWLWP